MSSIFSRIIKGDIPSYKIAQEDQYIAILDINPLKKGHSLVIPKIEIDKLFDLEKESYLGLLEFTRKIALSIKRVLSPKRVGMTVMGFEVPHAHIHLVPMEKESDLNFDQKRLDLSHEDLTLLAAKLAKDFQTHNVC